MSPKVAVHLVEDSSHVTELVTRPALLSGVGVVERQELNNFCKTPPAHRRREDGWSCQRAKQLVQGEPVVKPTENAQSEECAHLRMADVLQSVQ